MTQNEEYMTREDVAIRLGMRDRAVDAMIKRGELKAIKIGRLVRILKSSFDALPATMTHAK